MKFVLNSFISDGPLSIVGARSDPLDMIKKITFMNVDLRLKIIMEVGSVWLSIHQVCVF